MENQNSSGNSQPSNQSDSASQKSDKPQDVTQTPPSSDAPASLPSTSDTSTPAQLSTPPQPLVNQTISTPQTTPPMGNGTVPPVPPKKHSRMLVIAGLLFLGVGLLALWFYFTQSQKTLTTETSIAPSVVMSPGKIVVGTDPTYPPMEYAESDVLLGYDIDLANFIGKEMGTQIEFKNIVFDDLFTALEQKKVDMIISTVTVTEERKQKYDFSEPYLQGGQVILTQKANTAITSTADLKGKKIAVQKGTTIETEALKYTTNDLVIRYPDFVEATAALIKGDVDAIFADLPGAKGITNDNPTLKIASDPFTNEYYAVVFRKGDPKIKEINTAIASLKVKGILTDLKQKWLD